MLQIQEEFLLGRERRQPGRRGMLRGSGNRRNSLPQQNMKDATFRHVRGSVRHGRAVTPILKLKEEHVRKPNDVRSEWNGASPCW